MDSKNKKTFDPHRIMLYRSDNLNLKGSDKCLALSSLGSYDTRTNIKNIQKS